MYENEEQTEKERPRMRRGEEKVTVACRRVLDVVSGRPAWPVARGPWPGLCPRRNAARGPRRGTGRKRERETARLEGLTRPRRARERESPGVGGQNAFSLVLLLCLASSSKLLRRVPTPSSFSCHRLLSPSLSLSLPLRFSLAPPRALVRAHARTLVREGSRESRSFSRRLVP